MKENVISFSSEDFERLKKLIDSREYGFPVLAMQALAEREIAKANGYDYTKDKIEFTFADLCGMLSLTGKQRKSINEIKNDRNDYANYVRHGFKNLTPTDASLVENRFLNFVHAFNPAAENLKEYMEVKESVKLALSDKKMITISEDKYNEMLQAYPELRSTQARLDDAIRRYNEEHAKVEVLNKKLLDSEDKYKTDIKALNDKYDEKRQELFKSKRVGKIQIAELEKAKDELEKEKDAELRGIQAQHDAEIEKLSAERDGYLAELKKSNRIVDIYDFASQYYAYSEGRRSFIRSMMNLSRQQREIVDSVNLNSDFLIRGGAGSGKTLVLLAILKRLNEGMLDGMGSTCRFLTYTNTLSHFSKVIMPELAQTSGLDNRTVTSLLSVMTRRIFGRRFIFDDWEMAELTETLKKNPDYVQEIKLFIWAKNIDRETYLGGCERRGMKEGIGVEERQRIWAALEELEFVLQKDGAKWPVEYAVVRHLAQYENSPDSYNQFRCDYTLIDEFQDLSPAKLSLLKKLSNTAVYLAGDASQSIYKKAYYTLKETGISIEGRTRILDQCFRSTRQINDVCRKYRDDAEVKTEGRDAEEDIVNIRSGLPVSLQVFENPEECLGYLLYDVKALRMSMKVPLKDICIIAYTNRQIENIREVLEEAGIKTTIIDADRVKDSELKLGENNIFESDSVKLMTIHSSKGLEFPCVLFYGKENVTENGINQQSREKLKKDLVYVALTRACSILHIFYDRSTQSNALDLLDSEINSKPEPVPVVQTSTYDGVGDDGIDEYYEDTPEDYYEDDDEEDHKDYLRGFSEDIGTYYEEFGCSQEEMDDYLENCAENAD